MIDYSINTQVVPHEEKYKALRSLRYKRQRVSAEYANETGHGVRNCMRLAVGGSVHVMKSIETGRAYFQGLVTCGSVWDCPICASKVSARRSEELKMATDNWLEQGNAVVMVTYTIRHHWGDRLSDLARVMTNAIRYVHSGAPYKRIEEKYKIRGTVSATEILYNLENGWHYHKHQLLFFEGTKLDRKKLEEWIYARYKVYLNYVGYDIMQGVGVVVSEPEDYDMRKEDGEIEYLTKWGLEDEITSSEKKINSGFSPFQLLDDIRYKAQWLEYSKAMRGKRRLTWSRGLRALVGLDVEVSDEALSAEMEEREDKNELVLDIPWEEWKYILRHELRSYILCLAEKGELELYRWYGVSVVQMTGFLACNTV